MEILRKHSGKFLMITSALLTATGQLFWKMGFSYFVFMILGFICYGAGALLMIKSFATEKLSVAYPLMSISYIFALLLGGFILDEPITYMKIIAIIFLFIGVTFTSNEK
ncbi:EamA/RhaT family transporter [Neobacillus sp. K501]